MHPKPPNENQHRSTRSGQARRSSTPASRPYRSRSERPRRSALVVGLAVLMVAPLVVGGSPAAAADWFWGSSFRIGGLTFTIGHRPHLHGHGHFYRTGYAVPSRQRCTDRCFVQRRAHYHHESCPVVRGWFHRHGYSSYDVFNRYRPYSSTRYDRHDRYDRYNNYDGYGRWSDYDWRDRRQRDRYDRHHRRPRREWYRAHRHYHVDGRCPIRY